MSTETLAGTKATRYAERGWQVIPLHSIHDGKCTCGKADCTSPGKHPRTQNGLKDATTDRYQIRDWWCTWRTANIGIVTGAASNLVVLDVDPRHGGWESLTTLESEIGALPETVTVVTGGGGMHLYFSHPGTTIKNRSNLLPGLDIRGDNGYVVAPPANHQSGSPYRWEENRAPHEIQIAPLPAKLLDRLVETPQPKHETNGDHRHTSRELLLQRASQYATKAEAVSKGGRNQAAFNLAGNLASFDLRGDRLIEVEIVDLLRGWNLRNSPPLEDDELRQCVKSALENGKPRETKHVDPDRKSSQSEAKPQIKPIAKYKFGELLEAFPTMNPPVVDGLFREGETINIIANPKVGKSWLGYHLALSIVTGREWLGFPTQRGRVLLIDNELHQPTLAVRIPKVADALDLFPDDYATELEVWTLRGNLRSLERLSEDFEDIPKNTYRLIICDAKYRFGNGESENDNSAETRFYNTLDRLAEMTGSAVALIHHSSKGSQTEKRVTDVGAGAGAQSRAADCHVVLREHENDGIMVLDAAVRSFPPVAPIAIRWGFPLWRVSDADPTALKGKKSGQEQRQDERDKKAMEAICQALNKESRATIRKLRETTGLSRERLIRLLDKGVADGWLAYLETTIRGNCTREYYVNEAGVK